MLLNSTVLVFFCCSVVRSSDNQRSNKKQPSSRSSHEQEDEEEVEGCKIHYGYENVRGAWSCVSYFYYIVNTVIWCMCLSCHRRSHLGEDPIRVSEIESCIGSRACASGIGTVKQRRPVNNCW